MSPPSRMCSPTATRSSASSPLASVTAISVKSVVPPPISTTRIRSPELHALAPVGMPLDPGVEGRLRLFEQRDVAVAGLLRRPPVSARAPPHRTTPARSPAPAARRTARRASSRSRRRADAPDSGGWPPPARSSSTPSGARNGSSGDGAVDARMREPRFRRRHQPPGIFHAALLRQPADHVMRAPRPRAAPSEPAGKSDAPGR